MNSGSGVNKTCHVYIILSSEPLRNTKEGRKLLIVNNITENTLPFTRIYLGSSVFSFILPFPQPRLTNTVILGYSELLLQDSTQRLVSWPGGPCILPGPEAETVEADVNSLPSSVLWTHTLYHPEGEEDKSSGRHTEDSFSEAAPEGKGEGQSSGKGGQLRKG